MKRWASKLFTTLPGLFLTPVLYVIFAIKLVPPLTILCYGIMLAGIIAYPISQYQKHQRWSKAFSGVAKAAMLAVVTAIFIRVLIFHPAYIQYEGMVPTVQPAARVVGDRTSYWFKKPDRSDIVLIEGVDSIRGNRIVLVNRILGLPGEAVEVRQGEVLVNGKLLEEPYVGKSDGRYNCPIMKVPTGQYFTLLDNRTTEHTDLPCADHIIARKSIIAKITGRVFSWEPIE
jgi:signal peptidase I